ncbi:hypothetical protein VA7868_00876 [Vibrio aerogenes CECT 7868]|uniref:N-acetylmuramidase domain-containing protein n=1 Tax=Vibrio aerogenes CECT 7868 TaxID=1216006 RepID=A0A1M5WUP4_9VIBR|nr:N-acetylmuramidase family protein [Vibrio aerogenes]SHH91211.1 hypothetical protein VA7868_00876 [Vibrio aerogenes CECT 7868]
MKHLNLTAPVGAGAVNEPDDVLNIQRALNQIAEKIGLTTPLAEDGRILTDNHDSPTCNAIGLMQQTLCQFQHPDMRIDCNGKTHKTLDLALEPEVSFEEMFTAGGSPQQGLTEDDFHAASEVLRCETAAIQAVSEVESAGSGFFSNKLPIILFEAHKFSGFTHHRFDDTHPHISSRKWDRSLYLGGEKEYDRLKQAMALDSTAALKSASYGRYQLMGFNYQSAGYDNVQSLVHSMVTSERNHLMAFIHFIKSNPKLHQAMQRLNWPEFAREYNGPGYAANHYDVRLQTAYEHFNQHAHK